MPNLETVNIDVVLLEGSYKKGIITRNLVQRELISKVDGILKLHNKIEKVYLFADHIPVSQYIGFYCKKNCDSVVVKVEDGMEAYVDYMYKNSKFATFLKKVIYGRFYEPLDYQGAFSFNDYLLVSFPNCVSSNLRRKFGLRIGKLPTDLSFVRKAYEDILFGVKQIIYSKICDKGVRELIIVLLPLSEITRDNIESVYAQLISEHSRDVGKLLLAKYHPREHRYYMGSLNSSGIILPQEIPAELVHVVVKEFLEKQVIEKVLILGNISTSLLTARDILGFSSNVTIRAVAQAVDYNFSLLESLYRNLHIELA